MSPPLVLIPQYFGSLVFDRRTSRYAPFDHAATELLERAIAAPIDDGNEDEMAFLEHHEREGWLRPDGRLAAVRLDAVPPADHLLGPLATHIEVVAACNLTCTHCFAGTLPRKSTLRLDELDRLFGELAALGSYRVGLTGGEPLLRKDILDVLDRATSRGLHPCLTTNGLLLDEPLARELGKRKLVWLNVSLEGASAATNDPIRGAGTFDAVVAQLRRLGKHLRFTLAFTITKPSAKEAEACAKLARELGAHTAVFRPLYPVGVAANHPELMPTYDDYVGAVTALAGDLHGVDPFGPLSRQDTQASTYAGKGCGAANLVASVSASGDVNPCSFLGSAFDSGNIRERPFAEIWHDSIVFRRLREQHGEFRGGCRARALAAHGDVNARDPWHDAWLGEGLAPTTNVRRHLPLVRGA